MHKCFLTITLFLSLITPEIVAQRPPLDRCISDSLFRIKPHDRPLQKAKIYLELAELIKGDLPQKSFSYIVSAFKISIHEKNDSLKAKARMQMGSYYSESRRFMQAHEQYLAAANIYRAMHDTLGEVTALLNIGQINISLENYTKAMEYFQDGLGLVGRAGTLPMTWVLYEQIGTAYRLMGDRKKARYYFNKALSHYLKSGDRRNLGLLQNNLGTILLDSDQNKEALDFYHKLIQEADTNDPLFIGLLYTRIGHVHYKMKEFRTSLNYNLKALEMRQRAMGKVEVNSSLINVAGDYYNLGIPDSGKIYLDSGLAIAQKFNRKSFLENGYHHLYKYYLKQKNYKRAMDCYARFSNARDEIKREQYRNSIAIVETHQRLQRLQLTEKMISRQHDIQALNIKYQDFLSTILKILLVLSSVFMLVFAILFFYARQVRKKMQDINIQLLEEIRERKATEERTKDQESQYKFITDNSIDFISHLDTERDWVYASPASLKVFGYEPEEMVMKASVELTRSEYRDQIEEKFREMVESRSSRQFVYQAMKKDGTVFWVESVLNPLFDQITGVFKGTVGVARDIQERKTKEIEIMEGTKQKELLLKEIHHRVKNNFSILVSLINMQMAQTTNQELLQSLTNLQLRIRTMALVHEMLYRSNDFEKISFPGYLRTLASVIAGTYNRRDIELNIEADEVVMDIESSIPLGLIINEILSNAYKHAFPDGRTGKIGISFNIDQTSGVNTLVLQDDGVGMPNGVKLDQYKTMGLQVVQILCTQIEAVLGVSNNPGACFTITFHQLSK